MRSEVLSSDWITPAEALEILEARYGPATKALIADKLKDGLIHARAQLMWESDEPSLAAAWRNREATLTSSDDSLERNVAIDKTVWRSSQHWQWDTEKWRWLENRFVVTRRKKRPSDRTIIVGLSLRRKDVLGLDKPASKRSGKKPNYAGYANMFSVLLNLERTDGLSPSIFKTKAALQSRVLKEIDDLSIPNKDRLDDETMSRCAAAFWDRAVAPGK